ncbi:hypothetical protein CRG98_015813 [Punica granatum]|uniref:Uncharacterized protein n=1 Tax=Punica granatum TaxID=22663 RepID=A0A2I0K5K5_PUNGR|nr:hypothetical protein CRG98_015813 [Punica granatum]
MNQGLLDLDFKGDSIAANTTKIMRLPRERPSDNKYFEDAFKVYGSGVRIFKFSNMQDIWVTYLSKFVNRYGKTKLERARELFGHATEMMYFAQCFQLFRLQVKINVGINSSVNETQRVTVARMDPFTFHVINHGVDESLMNKILDDCREFFDLEDKEEKREYEGKKILDTICYGTSTDGPPSEALFWRDYLRVRVHPEFHSPRKPAGFRIEVTEDANDLNQAKGTNNPNRGGGVAIIKAPTPRNLKNPQIGDSPDYGGWSHDPSHHHQLWSLAPFRLIRIAGAFCDLDSVEINEKFDVVLKSLSNRKFVHF